MSILSLLLRVYVTYIPNPKFDSIICLVLDTTKICKQLTTWKISRTFLLHNNNNEIYLKIGKINYVIDNQVTCSLFFKGSRWLFKFQTNLLTFFLKNCREILKCDMESCYKKFVTFRSFFKMSEKNIWNEKKRILDYLLDNFFFFTNL